MATLHGLTLCSFAKSHGWGVALNGDGAGTMVAISILIIPTLSQIRTVLHQESTGPVPHGICHRGEDHGGHELPQFPPATSAEGSGMGSWPLCIITCPREMEQAAGDWAASIPPCTLERVMEQEGRAGGCWLPQCPPMGVPTLSPAVCWP